MATSFVAASENVASRITELVDTVSVAYINTIFNNILAELETIILLITMLYIVIMGFGVMRGLVDTPLNYFLESVVKLAIIYGLVTSWPLFSFYIVDVITNTPDALAGVISGSPTAGNTATQQIGGIYNRVVQSASYAMSQRGIFQPYILGIIILLPSTLMMIYALFLILLSKIAIAVLVGVAPIFILMLMFKVTSKMFEAWLRQVINYTLVIVFSVSILGITNDITTTVVGVIPERGIVLGDTLPACIVFLLIFLLLMQVQNIASSLAGGLSLSTQNIGQYFGRKADRAASRAAGSGAKIAGTGIKKGYQSVKNRVNVGTVKESK